MNATNFGNIFPYLIVYKSKNPTSLTTSPIYLNTHSVCTILIIALTFEKGIRLYRDGVTNTVCHAIHIEGANYKKSF